MPQGPVMHREDSPPRTELSTSMSNHLKISIFFKFWKNKIFQTKKPFFSSLAEEISPTISLKSKLGLNFMVSFTRQENENPLAKLLQANQVRNIL